ncbi:MAG: OPT/YSL family transporter [Ignavibacteriaceae bacterium]
MSEQISGQVKGLPENAYKELKEGEEYSPIMSPQKVYPEISTYSVIWGLIMAVLFSAAAAYLGLKIGQVFEAAIPIAIIAVGLSAATKRKNALGENVIIQSIGQNSGLIVAGAIFTIPALYILNLDAEFFQIFLASAFGGILGILFLIPFRKYFVAEMHGKFPFPEATATTEVLVAGEKGGRQALVLVVSGLIGGAYDFIIATFGWWSETFTTRVVGFGETLADKFKLVFRLNVGAAVTGLGYIVGLKYSAIICAGSFVAWYLLIPIVSYFGAGLTETFGTGATKLIPMKIIVVGIVFTAILLLVFFYMGVVYDVGWALAGLLIVLIISFLFTTVAANAIAIVGTNPVSGMTLMTLILSSIILTSVGLKGNSGMIAALIIGGVVCTAPNKIITHNVLNIYICDLPNYYNCRFLVFHHLTNRKDGSFSAFWFLRYLLALL